MKTKTKTETKIKRKRQREREKRNEVEKRIESNEVVTEKCKGLKMGSKRLHQNTVPVTQHPIIFESRTLP